MGRSAILRCATLAALIAFGAGCAPKQSIVQETTGAGSKQAWRSETASTVLRGQAIFRLDRMAIVATGAYLSWLARSGVSGPKDPGGWVVSALNNGGSVVAWVVLDDPARDLGWIETQIYFAPGANADRCARANSKQSCAGIETLDQARELTPEEVIQLRARRLIRAEPRLKVCTQAPANLLVLRETGRWLGYLFSTSSDPKQIVAAGHSRIEFNADASKIERIAPMFDACRLLPAPAVESAPESALESALESAEAIELVEQSVKYFHEGHVFLALEQQRPVLVRGGAGRAIRIVPSGMAIVLREEP